jgi:serine phosphatase RsbU (regulator of sigma subunit)
MSEPIRTLLVDDSEADADYVRGILEKLRPEHVFEVVWESDGRRALLRLAQQPYDLVLLDYQMPSMSGLELLRRIREAHQRLPVIMLTGMGNEAVAVEAMKRGAHDYLRKDSLTVPELERAILTVLERKRLEEELEQRRRAVERDLRMAREMQQAFLPQSFPHFAPQQPPDAIGLRFYHRYTPTLSVGGDFFDVLPIGEHCAGIFISDVEGHGIAAALVTAALRTLIEEWKEEAAEPDRFLGRINAGLHRILRQISAPIFASGFYVKLDLQQGCASFSNASHPPQLRVRRATGEVDRLFDRSKTGPLLGMSEEAVYPAHITPLDERDVLLMFTGGILNVPNAAGEPFGIARVESVVRETLRGGPQEMVDRIVESAVRHAGSAVFPEDVCIVGVEAGALLVRAARGGV